MEPRRIREIYVTRKQSANSHAAMPLREHKPRPLGLTWLAQENGWRLALYSKQAKRVVLQLDGEDDLVQPLLAVDLDFLRRQSGPIWHCRPSHAAAAEAIS